MASVAGCDRQNGQTAQPAQATAAAETLPAGTVDRSHHGARLPDLTFHDAAGRELRLTTLTGKPLLVNLWATWCAPCVAELPMLDHLASQAGGTAGAPRVVTISEDIGDAKDVGPRVTAFLKGKALDHLEPWLDPDNDAIGQWTATTLPTTILYDGQGREVWRITGGHDWTSADTARLLAEAKR